MTKQEVYRFAPYDIELEQACLGNCLIDNRLIDIAAEMLEPEIFYDPLHQRLFEMMVALHAEGSVTPLVVHACMKHDPGLVEVGGHVYLAGLAQAAPAMPNVRDYARILLDLAQRRGLIRLGEDAVNAAYDAPTENPTAAIAEKLSDDLSKVLAGTAEGKRKRPVRAAHAAHDMMRRIESQAVAEHPLGVKTEIDAIDGVIGGLFPGKLVIAAGRPGHGKSILATNIAKNVAHRGSTEPGVPDFGLPVDYLSGEMDNDELSARVCCDIDFDRCAAERLEPLAYGDFTQMRATGAMVTRLAEANLKLAELDLEFFDVSGLTLEWIESTCRRRSRAKPGHRLVIIDHLQLVNWLGLRRGGNRTEEQTEITKRLKALAKELGITILLLSQLSREVDKREDKHPIISDMRESGSIEQDADVVIMIMRPLLYAKEKIRAARNEEQRVMAIKEYEEAKGVLELAIPKNRGGNSADYRQIAIEPKASAIRDRLADEYGDEELKF